MTTIIVTHEDDEVDEFEFESGQNTISIGRRSSNDVCVPDLSISGRHAQITLQGAEAWLEDLNSTNGSYVNGQVIKRKAIRNGDDIILGKVRLAFVPSASARAAAEANHHAAEKSAASTGATSVTNDRVPVLESAGNFDDSFAESRVDHVPEAPANEAARNASDDDMSFDDDARKSARPPVDSKRKGSDVNVATAAAVATAIPVVGKVSNGHAAGNEGDNSPHGRAPHPLDGVERQSAPSQGQNGAPPMHELDKAPATSKGAVIEIKNGAKSGQILPIDKPVTTLGRPGIQIAAIMRKPDGYFLMHIESDDSVDRPTLNQDAIGDEPVLLHSGDELNVAGIDVEFMLS